MFNCCRKVIRLNLRLFRCELTHFSLLYQLKQASVQIYVLHLTNPPSMSDALPHSTEICPSLKRQSTIRAILTWWANMWSRQNRESARQRQLTRPLQLQFKLPLQPSGATYNSYTVTRCTPSTTIGCQLGLYRGYRLELFPIRSFYPFTKNSPSKVNLKIWNPQHCHWWCGFHYWQEEGH